jgi:YebC/PmpR family DNA-binding regulatory protein
MSGHSKWATIKHKKGAADAARGKLFAKLLRQVEVSAREGGGDLNANATLRTMVQKARDASVPVDTIDRAIKRGTGELEGVRYETIVYEGYAPAGVAMLVEVLSDNRNRTSAEIRNLFSKNGGNMAEPGAVAWQFERKGQIVVDASTGATEDDVMLAALEAGAEDVVGGEAGFTVTTEPGALAQVRAAFAAAGVSFESAQVTMVPSMSVPLEGEDAMRVLKLLDGLEDLDDVQDVYANFDISDEVMAQVG